MINIDIEKKRKFSSYVDETHPDPDVIKGKVKIKCQSNSCWIQMYFLIGLKQPV